MSKKRARAQARVIVERFERSGLSQRAFAEQSRARGILPLIVAWPLESQASGRGGRTEVEVTVERYQRAAAAAATAQTASFVDLLPPLLGRVVQLLASTRQNLTVEQEGDGALANTLR